MYSIACDAIVNNIDNNKNKECDMKVDDSERFTMTSTQSISTAFSPPTCSLGVTMKLKKIEASRLRC